MNSNCCQCKINCTLIAVIVSAIVGVAAAFLTFTGTLAVGTPLLWVFFGIAVAFLAVTLLSTQGCRRDDSPTCLCRALSVLLTGILGTILFSIILLTIDIATASVIAAIIAGLLFFFFTLTLTATACFVKCKADCEW